MVGAARSNDVLDLGSRLNSPLLTGQDYVSPSLRTSSQAALSLEVNLLEPTQYVTTPFSPAVPFSLSTGYRNEAVGQSMLHPLAMQSFQESMLNLTTDSAKPSVLNELSRPPPVFAAGVSRPDAAHDITLSTARDSPIAVSPASPRPATPTAPPTPP